MIATLIELEYMHLRNQRAIWTRSNSESIKWPSPPSFYRHVRLVVVYILWTRQFLHKLPTFILREIQLLFIFGLNAVLIARPGQYLCGIQLATTQRVQDLRFLCLLAQPRRVVWVLIQKFADVAGQPIDPVWAFLAWCIFIRIEYVLCSPFGHDAHWIVLCLEVPSRFLSGTVQTGVLLREL